ALTDTEIVDFYVFNISPSKGFVIVSGDDNVSPILGYSYESLFDPNNISHEVAKWLEGYKKEIDYVIEKKIQGTAETKKKWEGLKTGARKDQVTAVKNVNPLRQTTWNQS